MKPATASDLRWWGAVFGGVLATALMLYVAAFRLAPSGSVFSGFLLNSGDAWGYRAFVRAFAEGGWLIDNPLSDAFHDPAFFNLLWFALGKIQRLAGLPFLAVYYAFGILAAGLMFWVILRFCRRFAGEGAGGRFGFLLASFGGGLGWLTLLVSDDLADLWRPMDLYLPEGYPLQAALFAPHLALSIAMVGTILLWFWDGVSAGRRSRTIGAALLTLALSFFHPYHLATVGLVAGAWVALEQVLDRTRFHRGWIDLGVLGLAVLPALGYYRWLFRQPNWSMWASENIVPVKGAAPFLLGLGPLVGLAAVGAWRWGKRALDSRWRFLIVWAAVGIGLLHSYRLFKFEAKLVEGLILPLAALGAASLFGPDGPGSRRRRMAAAAALLILVPSHAMMAARSLDTVRQRDNYFPRNWLYGSTLTSGKVEAMRFLGRLDPGQVIITPPTVGSMIAGMTGIRPFIVTASLDVTPNFADKFRAVAQAVYFQPIAPYERYDLLVSNRIDLLWFSTGGSYTLDPSREPYLERVFGNDEVHIYAVRR